MEVLVVLLKLNDHVLPLSSGHALSSVLRVLTSMLHFLPYCFHSVVGQDKVISFCSVRQHSGSVRVGSNRSGHHGGEFIHVCLNCFFLLLSAAPGIGAQREVTELEGCTLAGLVFPVCAVC